jgi:hypothetical protein
MNLNEESLASLVAWTDPLGIVSIYVGRSINSANNKPTWPIELKNGLREIVAQVKAARPHAEWQAIVGRIEAISPEIDLIVDPSSPGNGRMLFVGVSDGRLERAVIQLALPTRASLDTRPAILPLAAALAQGLTSGLVAVQRDHVQLFEWRLDETEQLGSMPFAVETASPHAEPREQQNTVAMESFERRLDASRQRFFRRVARSVASLAERRGWRRLAVFGDARLSHVLLEAMPANDDVEVVADERVMDSADTLRQGASAVIHRSQQQRQLRLVEAVQELGPTNRRAALGLDETLDALNEGRVDHLILDSRALHAGVRSDEGLLFADGAHPPGLAVAKEPNLAEAMVRRALVTHARVTPVEEIAAQRLASCQGVAALLRW